MLTYQDLLAVGESDEARRTFVYSAIDRHKNSEEYEIAFAADQYDKHKNLTIMKYQKILYTVTGKAVPDNWTANFKMACRHFHRFVTQENQHLLGNGATWGNPKTADLLGTKKIPFDTMLQKIGKRALICAEAFGFWNYDHIEVFDLLQFVPLYDEENGSLMAGIRFWQLDTTKPVRATLYEIDGYTDYIWDVNEGRLLHNKRPYKLKIKESIVDGTEIYGGENYPSFPIIPMWGNPEHQSELVGMREQIDCYDLIKSGFANTVDEASIIYWTLQNAGGMDEVDLAEFVQRIKTVHAATVNDGVKAESHTQEAPYESREALLDRLDRDMYRDAMALDVDRIASGATTATQIKAAYEPLTSKCDDYEFEVLQFISRLLDLVGIDDEVSFTRSMIVNTTEDIQTLVQAADHLSNTYVTTKILELLGDGDQAETVLRDMDVEDSERIENDVPDENDTPDENATE